MSKSIVGNSQFDELDEFDELPEPVTEDRIDANGFHCEQFVLVLLGAGAYAAEHQARKVLFTSASQDQTLVKAWRFATILDRLTADIFVAHETDAAASV